MADLKNENCPCKRVKCEYHGNCEACRAHHIDHKYLPTCERLALKKNKDKKVKTKE